MPTEKIPARLATFSGHKEVDGYMVSSDSNMGCGPVALGLCFKWDEGVRLNLFVLRGVFINCTCLCN